MELSTNSGNVMITLKQSIVAMALMASIGNANATFMYFSGSGTTQSGQALTDWTSAVNSTMINGQSLTISTFETNYTNVSNATGLSFPTYSSDPGAGCTSSSTSGCLRVDESNPANNVNLSVTSNTALKNSNTSGVASFNGASSGIPGFQWNFNITSHETTAGGTKHSGVFFNDIPNGKTYEQINAFTNVLSIGKFNGFDSGDTHQYDEDNFSLEVTNGGLYAFAFNMVNNKKDGSTEWLEVFANKSDTGTAAFNNADGNALALFSDTNGNPIPGYTGTYEANFDHISFVGILATDISEVFRWLEFKEDTGSNDIGIFNLRFASVSAVPLPAAFWLFASGLLGLIGLRKKRQV